MRINQETYNKALNQYYSVANITTCCDMDNIRELCNCDDCINFSIVSDIGDVINIRYRDIVVTFKANKCMYQKFGGKAELIGKFKYYENEKLIGVYDLVGNELE